MNAAIIPRSQGRRLEKQIGSHKSDCNLHSEYIPSFKRYMKQTSHYFIIKLPTSVNTYFKAFLMREMRESSVKWSCKPVSSNLLFCQYLHHRQIARLTDMLYFDHNLLYHSSYLNISSVIEICSFTLFLYSASFLINIVNPRSFFHFSVPLFLI